VFGVPAGVIVTVLVSLVTEQGKRSAGQMPAATL